jgi:hypothetical protein
MSDMLKAASVAPVQMKSLTKRQKLEILRSQLDQDFNTFRPAYRDLSDYILPTRARFTITDGNKGDRRNLKILDSTATSAANTLRAGMMSGVTSPARRWFKLATPDPDLNKFSTVKDWLFQVAEIMNTSFLRSNFYQTMPLVYGDLGTFGTAPYSVEEDFANVLHTQSFPVGSYRIAKDSRGRVNVFLREFRMTVQQVLQEFGDGANTDWSKFSDYVKNQYMCGNYQTWVEIVHVVSPNEDHIPGSPFSPNKKFMECYYERGFGSTSTGAYVSADFDTYLSEKGYDIFPIMCPRWQVTGEDAYATDCPGMTTIGDIKQLQWGEKRIAQAIDKIINPPMKGPAGMRNVKSSILPGDMTYFDEREGRSGFSPVYQIDPRIQEMEGKQEQVRKRIDNGFYKDMFLMMSNTDRRDITAREIDERHEEKLLALGPVMEQINQDGLDPTIDISFAYHLRQRRLPPPPKELQGMTLSVEYISIMAQAQKMVGIGSIERFSQFSGQLAGLFPGSSNKVNAGKMIDIYGDTLSLQPGIVRSDEEVAAIEQQQQQQQAAQQKMMAMKEGANAANKLAGADMSSDNALTRFVESQQNNQGSGGGVPTA